jgi:predicted PurR-regulated permease PerM
VVSRLEAALSLAMAVFFVCLLAGWETVSKIAGALLLALAVAFAVRLVYRKLHGASWDQAWGRIPRRNQ